MLLLMYVLGFICALSYSYYNTGSLFFIIWKKDIDAGARKVIEKFIEETISTIKASNEEDHLRICRPYFMIFIILIGQVLTSLAWPAYYPYILYKRINNRITKLELLCIKLHKRIEGLLATAPGNEKG